MMYKLYTQAQDSFLYLVGTFDSGQEVVHPGQALLLSDKPLEESQVIVLVDSTIMHDARNYPGDGLREHTLVVSPTNTEAAMHLDKIIQQLPDFVPTTGEQSYD